MGPVIKQFVDKQVWRPGISAALCAMFLADRWFRYDAGAGTTDEEALLLLLLGGLIGVFFVMAAANFVGLVFAQTAAKLSVRNSAWRRMFSVFKVLRAIALLAIIAAVAWPYLRNGGLNETLPLDQLLLSAAPYLVLVLLCVACSEQVARFAGERGPAAVHTAAIGILLLSAATISLFSAWPWSPPS